MVVSRDKYRLQSQAIPYHLCAQRFQDIAGQSDTYQAWYSIV